MPFLSPSLLHHMAHSGLWQSIPSVLWIIGPDTGACEAWLQHGLRAWGDPVLSRHYVESVSDWETVHQSTHQSTVDGIQGDLFAVHPCYVVRVPKLTADWLRRSQAVAATCQQLSGVSSRRWVGLAPAWDKALLPQLQVPSTDWTVLHIPRPTRASILSQIGQELAAQGLPSSDPVRRAIAQMGGWEIGPIRALFPVLPAIVAYIAVSDDPLYDPTQELLDSEEALYAIPQYLLQAFFQQSAHAFVTALHRLRQQDTPVVRVISLLHQEWEAAWLLAIGEPLPARCPSRVRKRAIQWSRQLTPAALQQGVHQLLFLDGFAKYRSTDWAWLALWGWCLQVLCPFAFARAA